MSNFMRGLSETLGIKVAASMAYHPQTDGQTQCINQEVEQFHRLFVNQRQDDWYDWISSLPITTESMPQLKPPRSCSTPVRMTQIQTHS